MLTVLLLSVGALAKSWCADPLVAHEWGVTVLTGDASAPERPELPAYFHRPEDPYAVAGPPVRTLPPDSGVRTLPVVHLYAPPGRDTVPLAAEVGFRDGEASVWYPAVDRRIPVDEAHGVEAAAQRARLLAWRAQLTLRGEREDLGPDPTRQLHWTALSLTPRPTGRPARTDTRWVQQARDLPHALWVNQGTQSERFLFYEADTEEPAAVTVRDAGAGVVRVTNVSEHPVHDVWVTRDGRAALVGTVGPGATVRAVLGPMAPDIVRQRLTDRWTADADLPLARDWTREDCVMMRDPMLPVEEAEDHRLYPGELDLLWSVWADRLLHAEGDRVVYREDPAALDAAMPVSLYTDMFHFVRWSRLGLVVVERLEVR